MKILYVTDHRQIAIASGGFISDYLNDLTFFGLKELKRFLETKAKNYTANKNNPSLDVVSNMSPYLHFGQISPLEIALEVLNQEIPQDSKDSYLEELIIRRELSFNFVFFKALFS